MGTPRIKQVHFGRLRELPSGKWQASEPAGPGKYKPAPHTFATRKAARTWLGDRERAFRLGQIAAIDDTRVWTFGEVAERYLEIRRRKLGNDDLSPKTIMGLEETLRRVLPKLGHLPVASITKETVEEFQEYLRALPSVRSKTASGLLGQRSIQRAERTAKWIMNYALRQGLITKNPFNHEDIVLLNKQFHRDDIEISQQQVLTWVDCFDTRYSLFPVLAAFCGLRLGELLALKAGDITLARNFLSVNRNLTEVPDRLIPDSQRLKTGVRIGLPKNRKARMVVFPDFVSAYIDTYLKDHRDFTDDSYLFADSVDNLGFRPSKFYKHYVLTSLRDAGLRDVLDRAGTDKDAVTHTMRHFCTTWMLTEGYTQTTVQQSIGHSNAEMTRRYSHLMPDTLSRFHAEADARFALEREKHQKTVARSMAHQEGLFRDITL